MNVVPPKSPKPPIGCPSLTMMHASILAIWYVIKWHKIRSMPKQIEYFNGNSHPAMLSKFQTFLQCNSGYLKGEIMLNFCLGKGLLKFAGLVFTDWLHTTR